MYDCSLACTSCVSDISNITDSPIDVEKLLANLVGGFLISCAGSLALPICLLFRRLTYEHTVPMIWKRAYITPVRKKGQGLNLFLF